MMDLVPDEFEAKDFAVPGYSGFAVWHGNGDVVEDAVGGLRLDEMETVEYCGGTYLLRHFKYFYLCSGQNFSQDIQHTN